jgi:hypothetical protein
MGKSEAVINAIIEAVIALVMVGLVDLYIIIPETILNSTSVPMLAVVKPILAAVILMVGIFIAIGLLRSAAKSATGGK